MEGSEEYDALVAQLSGFQIHADTWHGPYHVLVRAVAEEPGKQAFAGNGYTIVSRWREEGVIATAISMHLSQLSRIMHMGAPEPLYAEALPDADVRERIMLRAHEEETPTERGKEFERLMGLILKLGYLTRTAELDETLGLALNCTFNRDAVILGERISHSIQDELHLRVIAEQYPILQPASGVFLDDRLMCICDFVAVFEAHTLLEDPQFAVIELKTCDDSDALRPRYAAQVMYQSLLLAKRLDLSYYPAAYVIVASLKRCSFKFYAIDVDAHARFYFTRTPRLPGVGELMNPPMSPEIRRTSLVRAPSKSRRAPPSSLVESLQAAAQLLATDQTEETHIFFGGFLKTGKAEYLTTVDSIQTAVQRTQKVVGEYEATPNLFASPRTLSVATRSVSSAAWQRFMRNEDGWNLKHAGLPRTLYAVNITYQWSQLDPYTWSLPLETR